MSRDSRTLARRDAYTPGPEGRYPRRATSECSASRSSASLAGTNTSIHSQREFASFLPLFNREPSTSAPPVATHPLDEADGGATGWRAAPFASEGGVQATESALRGRDRRRFPRARHPPQGAWPRPELCRERGVPAPPPCPGLG